MMPLRKMRSRSLAVVELVLSLRVSSAWCMAAERHTEEGGKKSLFFFSPWEIDGEKGTGQRRQICRSWYSRNSERRGSSETGAASHFSPPARNSPPSLSLLPFRLTQVTVSPHHQHGLPALPPQHMLKSAHAHTNTPLASLSLSETRPCSPDHKGFGWMSGALVLNSTLLQADKKGPAYLLF